MWLRGRREASTLPLALLQKTESAWNIFGSSANCGDWATGWVVGDWNLGKDKRLLSFLKGGDRPWGHTEPPVQWVQ